MGSVFAIGQTSDALAVAEALRESVLSGQTNTILAIHCGDDGEPYVSFANPGVTLQEMLGLCRLLELTILEQSEY